MGKPKSQKAPALPPPQVIPQTSPESTDEAMRRYEGRAGFRKTVLTGALAPTTGKKTSLGG